MSDPTDTDIHDALMAYTRTEPPLSFTYDQVLAGGSRTRRRHRFAIVGAAAVAVAAAAGGVAIAVPHRHADPAPYTAAGPAIAPSRAAPSAETTPPTAGATTPAKPATVMVPDVRGQNAMAAKGILEQAGFSHIDFLPAGQHTTVPALPRHWTVNAQSAAPGTALPTDSLITLTCAKQS